MWFDNWAYDLVQLGFAVLGDAGDIVHIADDQLGRIINFMKHACHWMVVAKTGEAILRWFLTIHYCHLLVGQHQRVD
jgi:hypothetical protein